LPQLLAVKGPGQMKPVRNNSLWERLRGGLIVSVQADAGSLLNEPPIISTLARVAEANGAVGVRVEGVDRIRAVRAALDIPVVGIIKCEHPGFETYITSTLEEVERVIDAGADVVAFDATLRERDGGASVATLVDAVHARGRTAMADCATIEDGRRACFAGADILATTLVGYTLETLGAALPALDVLAALAALHPFVVCEGGVSDPKELRAALDRGASAVVVGTVITNVDALVRRFVAASDRARGPHTS
jgi:N-acylglucosamine-6-phosphate 2-epimerase